MSIAVGADGDLLVQQLDGEALRFRLPGSEFTPQFVGRFRVDSSIPGSGFDGPQRVLVPTAHGIHVYGPAGDRMMAADPQRDLSQQPFSSALHIRRGGGRLYLLDTERNSLWILPE
jgi:hypothetical protein